MLCFFCLSQNIEDFLKIWALLFMVISNPQTLCLHMVNYALVIPLDQFPLEK